MLYEKLDFAFGILAEILTRSKFDDAKRLGEILAENKSRARMRLESASHSAAVARATSYFSPAAAFNDVTGGIGYYHFLEKICGDAQKPEAMARLLEKLREVSRRLFVRNRLLLGFTAD